MKVPESMMFCDFQPEVSFAGEVQMQNQLLLCNILLKPSSKAVISRNPHYDGYASSMADDVDCVHLHFDP